MPAQEIAVAACQYPIERLDAVADWQQKIEKWVANAAEGGAKLLVFPEYAGLELIGTLSGSARLSLKQQLVELQPLGLIHDATHQELARRYGLAILAGSRPEWLGDRYVNRARFYMPSGSAGVVDKLQLTRFEDEHWGIARGRVARVFDTDLGRIAVAICYDAEFPWLVRKLAEHEAKVILVPSCTDTMAGYHRVRLACQARALENQCYMVQAVTVGFADYSLAIDENHGAAGIFAPPDYGFPDDGVLAQGTIDAPSLVHARLDLEAVDSVRSNGQVLNYRDWSRGAGSLVECELDDLTCRAVAADR